MIIQVVRAILLSDGAINTALGGRVFPQQLPEATDYPACVLTKASGLGEYTLDGDSGVTQSRIQVDLYEAAIGNKGYASLIATKKLVRAKLSGFRGSPPLQSGCVVMTSQCINDMDIDVPETIRTEPTLLRRMLEFSIIHKET